MKQDKEQLILEIARRHFVKNGYEGTRMEEIAKEAGVTKAMVHYYFRTKDKLFHGIVIQIINQNIQLFAEAWGQVGPFWERVEGIIEKFISTLLSQPDTPFFIMYELSQQRESFVEEFKKRSAYFPNVLSFLQHLQEEMDAGRIKKMPPMQVLLSIVSMCVFPFLAKPVFSTIMDVSDEQFIAIMEERKSFVLSFLKSALAP